MSDLFTLAWQYSAGLVMPEDLPMAAADLLAAGVGAESSALCELAGRRGYGESSAELKELLWQAMAELGLPVPDDDVVLRSLLHHTAAGLTSGEITPEEAFGRLYCGFEIDLTEAERGFLAVADQNCCPGCLRVWPSAVRQKWGEELRAAAAEVVSTSDHAFAVSRYRG
ncbi:hypothetical protein [Kitasatospora brasiliensis]|uniref:hypothetical protein n=1 Tax=Kitasatospora brasiliensis TaxID=3058040 RepID=UPI00292FEE91|nr:hypothetical protein [Kitasatospora sp. K002]